MVKLGFMLLKRFAHLKQNKTSTPVVRTGVYPHMPIAVTANSLQHWPSPSKRWRVSHMVHDGRASLSHRANHRQTFYRLFSFWPWGLTLRPKVTKRGDDLLSMQIYHPTKFQPNRTNGLRDMCYQSFSLFGQSSPKGEMTWRTPRSTPLYSSAASDVYKRQVTHIS